MSTTEDTLKGLSFYRDYIKYRRELISQASFVYSVVKQLVGVAPTRMECRDLFAEALSRSPFYLENMAKKKKFLPTNCYQACAHLLAEYVVEKHWAEIENP